MSRPSGRSADLRAEVWAYAEPLADLVRAGDPSFASAFAADLVRRREAFPFTAFGNFLSPGEDPDRDEIQTGDDLP